MCSIYLAKWFHRDKMYNLLCVSLIVSKRMLRIHAERKSKRERVQSENVVFENYAKWNGDATEPTPQHQPPQSTLKSRFSISNIFQYIIVMELKLTTFGNWVKLLETLLWWRTTSEGDYGEVEMRLKIENDALYSKIPTHTHTQRHTKSHSFSIDWVQIIFPTHLLLYTLFYYVLKLFDIHARALVIP